MCTYPAIGARLPGMRTHDHSARALAQSARRDALAEKHSHTSCRSSGARSDRETKTAIRLPGLPHPLSGETPVGRFVAIGRRGSAVHRFQLLASVPVR